LSPKIYVAFFGITRSLSNTLPAIETQVLAPCRALGETRLGAHLFQLSRVENPRTGESHAVDPDDHNRLHLQDIALSPPGDGDIPTVLDQLKSFGDAWEDGFQSLSNLVHQLASLQRVTVMARVWQPDVTVFCRPDLLYHDSFAKGLAQALAARQDLALVPGWQRHKGGVNDRFAVCRGADALTGYGDRLTSALSYCQRSYQPLHAERLLRFSLEEAGVRIGRLDVRGSRVRAGGRIETEDFRIRRWKTYRNYLRYRRDLRG
jgi:hypothetical protein